MGNNTQNMKEITSSKDHHTSYNIVDVCKQTIVDVDEDLQNYNEADLPG